MVIEPISQGMAMLKDDLAKRQADPAGLHLWLFRLHRGLAH